jgi:hypothetical protein
LINLETLQRIYGLGLSKAQLCEILLIIAEVAEAQKSANDPQKSANDPQKSANDPQKSATLGESAHISISSLSSKSREVKEEVDTALIGKPSTRKPSAREGLAEARWAFWRAYPKRINKLAAFRNFDRTVMSGVSADIVIAAAKRYAKATQATEKQFIKAPDVWLNKGCWDDEPAHNRVAPAGRSNGMSGAIASFLGGDDDRTGREESFSETLPLLLPER